jgi:hypothetical protein
MTGDYEPLDTRTGPRRPLISYLILPGLFFLLGVGAMGWLLTRWERGAEMLGIAAEPPAAVQTAAPPPESVEPAEQQQAAALVPANGEEPERILIDPEVGRRVAALEQRIAQLDNQSRAAVGNADRAEGLLVAFAARRALDRGVALGYLEALLRQRFGESQPQAVGMIIGAAREPVTLQELQDGLAQVGPQLAGAGPQQNWWGAFRAELGNLITVRREGTPSPEPAERLARAQRWLEVGEVGPALAEVQRLPGRDYAADWVAHARRYVGARRALDTIETAALLGPRTTAQAVAPRPTAAQPQQRSQPQPQRPQAQTRPRPTPSQPSR